MVIVNNSGYLQQAQGLGHTQVAARCRRSGQRRNVGQRHITHINQSKVGFGDACFVLAYGREGDIEKERERQKE